MRTIALTALSVLGLPLLIAVQSGPAQADPYRWCAQYRMGGGGVENCYFLTREQCEASISGNGGFCRLNNFYDGKPVRTPEDRRRG